MLQKCAGMLHFFHTKFLGAPHCTYFSDTKNILTWINALKCNFSRTWLHPSPHPICTHTFFKALCSQPYREAKRYNLYLSTLELFLWPCIFMPLGKHHWTPPRVGGAVRYAPFNALLLSLPTEPLTLADKPGVYYSPIQWNLIVFRLDIISSFHGNSMRTMKYSNYKEKR